MRVQVPLTADHFLAFFQILEGSLSPVKQKVPNFVRLDYVSVNHFLAALQRFELRSTGKWFLLSAIIGLVAGLGAIGFHAFGQDSSSAAGVASGSPSPHHTVVAADIEAYEKTATPMIVHLAT